MCDQLNDVEKQYQTVRQVTIATAAAAAAPIASKRLQTHRLLSFLSPLFELLSTEHFVCVL